MSALLATELHQRPRLRIITDEDVQAYARELAELDRAIDIVSSGATAADAVPQTVRTERLDARNSSVNVSSRQHWFARAAAGVLAVGTAIGVGTVAGLFLADAPAPGESVVVTSGDTLWSIAQEHVPGSMVDETVAQIMSLNSLSSSTVVPGQTLVLPSE